MSAARTMEDLLQRGADDAPAIRAPAIQPPGRRPLTHGALRALARSTVAALNGRGIGRGDRVAIVLPNGPEMAAAFLCIATGASTAPLNPAYRGEEFSFYLEDLKAKAIVLQRGVETPARAAAEALGIPILELVPGEAAGSFTLEGGGTGTGAAARPGMAQEEDEALVLHTSGTTARPKIVPLSQRNIAASAGISARRWSSRRPMPASTSCRSSTSTG
jgi:acyl-CoA synthetase (AMP-forming)/AMP-acid ligase II